MYNWIESTFNVSEGLAQGLALIISLAVVLVLFGLFVFIIKRLMGTNLSETRGRQPRVAVMDSTTVDTRRRLLLIRRDNVEHLLLVGGPADLVVEQNIVRHAPVAAGHIRSATYQGNAAGSGMIKTPSAPGPDIPATPEDVSIPQSPADTLRAQAQTKTHTPATGSLSAKTADPVSRLKKDLRAGAGDGTSAHDVRMSDNQLASREDPKSKQTTSPEADLVRAATKPAEERKQVSSPPLQSRTPSLQSAIPQPPADRGEAKSDPATAKPEAAPEKSAPKVEPGFRSVGKPFSPKDRPSYGTHKISPPASGPAARAKTALLSPVEAEPDPARQDPGLNGTLTAQNGSADAKTVPVAATAIAPTKEAVAIESTAANQPSLSSDAKDKTPEQAPAVKTEANEALDEARNSPATVPTPETGKGETADAAQTSDTGAKTSDAEPQGLGDRNPIEAEMAKILNEVGEQQKL